MNFLLFKIADQLAKPTNVFLAAAALPLFLAVFIHRRWLVWLAAFGMVLYVGCSVVPLGEWLLVPLENRFSAPRRYPDDIDGIAIISDRIAGEVSRARGALDSPNEAILTIIELGRHYQDLPIVLTGIGESTSAYSMSHADTVRTFLERQGFDPSRVTFADKARNNTYDTVHEAFEAVKPQPGSKWLLVRSAADMPRSIGVARKLGWEVEPWPVAYITDGEYHSLAPHIRPTYYLYIMDVALREWSLLALYYSNGWTSELFPAPHPSEPAIAGKAS
jgi:uncharacterized SAM-binding protein YcdF (DUF218 family)